MSIEDSAILVTGGTGSFGRQFTQRALANLKPREIRIFSRDEVKQAEMQSDPRFEDERLRFFIGDVRDRDRLQHVMEGTDLVVHAAAMKHVPVCEVNPFEAVKTNILGGQNVIEAAIELEIPRVMSVSTDKAVNPASLYGATKLCAEKMFTAARSYVGKKNIRISCVRYGNLIGSRGRVIPLFLSQRARGRLTITDERMTRFWITLEEAVEFVVASIDRMRGGEIFVPKLPVARIRDLADVIAPEAERAIVGIRPGEKVHEVLLTEDEGRIAREYEDFFVIEPHFPGQGPCRWREGKPTPAGFCYSSDTQDWKLSAEELRSLVKQVEDECVDEMSTELKNEPVLVARALG